MSVQPTKEGVDDASFLFGNAAGSHENPTNQTILQGMLSVPVDMRYTPTGRPVARFALEHTSVVQDLAPLERLEVRMDVIAVGATAEGCRHLNIGQFLYVKGRLNQKRWLRNGKVRWGKTELVALDIQTTAPPSLNPPENVALTRGGQGAPPPV
ncbi:MAG: single-stranded DNA-binding protein [Magnetococcus sp. DMHC-6]